VASKRALSHEMVGASGTFQTARRAGERERPDDAPSRFKPSPKTLVPFDQEALRGSNALVLVIDRQFLSKSQGALLVEGIETPCLHTESRSCCARRRSAPGGAQVALRFRPPCRVRWTNDEGIRFDTA
jgi:hypothetical protein